MKKATIIMALIALYLGTHSGQLALWQAGQDVPTRIYPYRADLYSEKDQIMLENGIEINNSSSLQKHLDDFLS